jgi:hypothetical protein
VVRLHDQGHRSVQSLPPRTPPPLRFTSTFLEGEEAMARTFKADVRFRFAPTALSLLPAAFFAALAFAYSAYTTWKAKSRKRARGRRDW